MKYAIKLHPSVKKQLKKIDRKQVERILVKVFLLGNDPFPRGCEQITGQKAYRIRIGSYRVIYEVQKQKLIVLVIRVGHRKDIYRK